MGCPAVAALAAYVTSSQLAPVYRVSTILIVEQSIIGEGPIAARIARTYVQLLTERPVLDAAIGELALDNTREELKRITAEVIPSTHLIRLSVEDTDPVRAAVLANTIASQFITQIQALHQERYADSLDLLQQQMDELASLIEETQAAIDTLGTPETAEEEAELARLETKLDGYNNSYAALLASDQEMRLAAAQAMDNLIVLEQAQVPTAPIRPRIALNTALGGATGMVLAIGFVVLFIVTTVMKSSRNHQKKL